MRLHKYGGTAGRRLPFSQLSPSSFTESSSDPGGLGRAPRVGILTSPSQDAEAALPPLFGNGWLWVHASIDA